MATTTSDITAKASSEIVSVIDDDDDDDNDENDGIIASSQQQQHPQHPRIVRQRRYALLFYYFWHGFREDLTYTSMYLILKDKYQLSPPQYSFVSLLSWIPWAMKPVFGYVSDRYPIWGLRRTPYFVVGLFGCFICWILLWLTGLIQTTCLYNTSSDSTTASSNSINATTYTGDYGDERDDDNGITRSLSLWNFFSCSRYVYIITMFVAATSGVMAETACDSLLAEMARHESDDEFGSIQSQVWSIDAAGSLIGSFIPIFGFSIWNWNPNLIVLMNATVIGLSALSLPWIQEDHVNKFEIPNVNLKKHVLQNTVLLKALGFVLIVSSSPTSGSAFTYFQSDVLGFSPGFLSWTTVIQTGANFVAAALYATYMRHWKMRNVFKGTIMATMIIGLVNISVVQRWNTKMGIPDKAFIVGDTLAQGVSGEIAFMPVAVLAARMAPEGGEGVVYSVTMSILNVGWALSEFFSGLLSSMLGVHGPQYNNLSWLMVCVSVLTLVPLFFLQWVPDRSELDDLTSTATTNSLNNENGITTTGQNIVFAAVGDKTEAINRINGAKKKKKTGDDDDERQGEQFQLLVGHQQDSLACNNSRESSQPSPPRIV